LDALAYVFEMTNYRQSNRSGTPQKLLVRPKVPSDFFSSNHNFKKSYYGLLLGRWTSENLFAKVMQWKIKSVTK